MSDSNNEVFPKAEGATKESLPGDQVTNQGDLNYHIMQIHGHKSDLGVPRAVYPSLSRTVVTDQPLRLDYEPIGPSDLFKSTNGKGHLFNSTNEASNLFTGTNGNAAPSSINLDSMIPSKLIHGYVAIPHVNYAIPDAGSDVMRDKSDYTHQHSAMSNGVAISRSSSMSNVPPGLKCLSQVNKVLINREEDKCGGGKSLHKYKLQTDSGYLMYTAVEEHFAWNKFGQGCQQKLLIHLLDHEGIEVIKATKELTFSDGEMLIEAPVGEVCGYVRKTDVGYIILNSNKENVLTIRNSLQIACMCRDYNMKVFGLDGSTLGQLKCQNYSSYFSVTFPKDLDFRMKAIILSFSILYNFR